MTHVHQRAKAWNVQQHYLHKHIFNGDNIQIKLVWKIWTKKWSLTLKRLTFHVCNLNTSLFADDFSRIPEA